MRPWKPALAAGVLLAAGVAAAQPAADVPPGKTVYDGLCASCHQDAPEGDRTPPVAALRKMSAEQISAALKTGAMKAIGDSLSAEQVRDVSAWLATPEAPPPAG